MKTTTKPQSKFLKNVLGQLEITILFIIIAGVQMNVDAQQCTEAQRALNNGKCPGAASTKQPGKSGGRKPARRKSDPDTQEPKPIAYRKTPDQPKTWPQVTIILGAPDLELTIDKVKAGTRTDADGKFVAFLKPGKHLIEAQKDNNILLEATEITITKENTSFDKSAEVKGALAKLEKPMTPMGPPVGPKPIDAKEIMDRYINPKTTDTVTIDDWKAIAELKQPNNPSSDAQALLAFAQGQYLLAKDDIPQAINFFSAATVFSPNSAIAFYGLGNANLKANNLNEADAAYRKAIQIDNKFSLAYKQIGDIYAAEGRPRESISYYQQAKNLGMDTPAVRLKLAENLIKSKNCPAALNELDSLQKDSPSASVFIALGDCYTEQKRTVKAIEALQKAIQIEPNSAQAYYKLGLVLFKQKEYIDAKKNFQKASELDAEGKTIDRKELQGLIDKIGRRLQ